MSTTPCFRCAGKWRRGPTGSRSVWTLIPSPASSWATPWTHWASRSLKPALSATPPPPLPPHYVKMSKLLMILKTKGELGCTIDEVLLNVVLGLKQLGMKLKPKRRELTDVTRFTLDRITANRIDP